MGVERAADLSIDFQRLLNAAGKSRQRTMYESALAGILAEFSSHIIVPLKQRKARRGAGPVIRSDSVYKPTSIFFLGHSFADGDKGVVDCVKQTFEVPGIPVLTGDRPKADRISEKVKRLIDAQPVFAGCTPGGTRLLARRNGRRAPGSLRKGTRWRNARLLSSFKRTGSRASGA